MAIPEPPPSTRRRSLMLLFLLLSLVGSLGLASGLLGWKGRAYAQMDFAYRIPKGFVHEEAVPGSLPFMPTLALSGQVNGGKRYIFVFHGQIDTFDDPDHPLRGEVIGFYRQLFATQPDVIRASVLDGKPALDVYGNLEGEAGFVLMRGAIVEKRQLVVVVYRGEGEPAYEDQKIFYAFTGPTFNIIGNQPPEKK